MRESSRGARDETGARPGPDEPGEAETRAFCAAQARSMGSGKGIGKESLRNALKRSAERAAGSAAEYIPWKHQDAKNRIRWKEKGNETWRERKGKGTWKMKS